MKYTANYSLKKPEYTDASDIEDINFNADAIDTAVAQIEQDISGLVPMSKVGVAGGVAPLDSSTRVDRLYMPPLVAFLEDNGRLPTTSIPYNVPLLDGLGRLPVAYMPTEVVLLDGSGKIPAAYLPDGALTFVYQCTGTSDDLAIRTIVDNFFTSSPANAMNLIITGTMGLQSPSGVHHLIFSDGNARKAVCNLDFTNCHVPEIRYTNIFLHAPVGSAVRVNVTGLNLTSSATGNYSIRTDSATAQLNLINCSFAGTANAGHVYTTSIVNCVNCNFSTTSCTTQVVYMNGATANFTNCRFINTGATNVCKLLSIEGNGKSCTVVSSYFENESTAGSTCVNLYSGNTVLSNCYIRSASTTIGAVSAPSYLSRVVIDSCKIWGYAYGIQTGATNTNTEFKITNNEIHGGTQSVEQTSAASTIRWAIWGNTFNKAGINVNGLTNAVSATGSAYISFVVSSNVFSKTIT